ncbi:MAG: RAMP superfamily CRISPR-associated protein [Chloroflexota bacterium]
MKIRIQLRSDTAFGRGDGIAGLVNSEIEHDAQTGFPFIKGRTLKGLLVESCADILYALDKGNNNALDMLMVSASRLFGQPGTTYAESGHLHIGKAQLPADLRQHLQAYNADRKAKGRSGYSKEQVMQAFTTIRHQTAVDAATGTPKDSSLRATRIILRETIFYASVHAMRPLDDTDYALLAACAKGVKRGGQNRTRGLGWLDVTLTDDDGNPLTEYMTAFVNEIGGNT